MPEKRERVTLQIDEYERECGEPNCCYEWGYHYYIDGVHVFSDSDYIVSALISTLVFLGYDVTTTISYLHGDINFEGANSNE